VNLRYVGDISEVYEFLPDDCRIIITDNGALGQILNKDVSKAGGVKALAEVLGIGLDEVISFGDDYNDIEMIRECGIGVAMGNAPQDIKDAADIITASNDEDGVAIILEKLLENNMIISKSGFIW
jgi:hydroxymethylpyrimidine pyrophosphatase-like HAD family hydrolase